MDDYTLRKEFFKQKKSKVAISDMTFKHKKLSKLAMISRT